MEYSYVWYYYPNGQYCFLI